MSQKVSLFWFRRDLRLEDNAGLWKALNSGVPVVPIFIFDPKFYLSLRTNMMLEFLFFMSGLGN